MCQFAVGILTTVSLRFRHISIRLGRVASTEDNNLHNPPVRIPELTAQSISHTGIILTKESVDLQYAYQISEESVIWFWRWTNYITETYGKAFL
jgi:hypothetical protein